MTNIRDAMAWALLFCPGNRPERFAKAAATADVAVLDLEDGVAAAQKDAAREAVARFLCENGGAGLAVRVNLPSTERGKADIAAVSSAGARLVLLPKTETTEEIDAVVALVGSGCEMIASIETAAGLQAVERIAAHRAVGAISWGPYDLAADIGMRGVRDDAGQLPPPLVHARSRLLFAAAGSRKVALDTVTAELTDPMIIARDAEEGAMLGFRGKFAIHPSQVAPIRAAYRPTVGQVERSRRLLAAVDGRGVFVFEGEMVDEPMLRRARSIVAAASEKASPQ